MSEIPEEISKGDASKAVQHATSEVINATEQNLIEQAIKGSGKKYPRFVLAALGSIPWVGGVLGAIAALSAEMDQDKINELQKLWLQEHQEKIRDLGSTIDEILHWLDGFGEEVQKRIESPEYLNLVRKAFRSWDQADTLEKRQMIKKLLINAGAIKVCTDDLVRLFLTWIDSYHEVHFAVIKSIYDNPGSTRGEVWDEIHGEEVREDSAEADLFKLLIDDLSLGHVIGQQKLKDAMGNTIVGGKRTRPIRKGPRPATSAFDDTKGYEMTSLGGQFVQYVLEDASRQLGTGQE